MSELIQVIEQVCGGGTLLLMSIGVLGLIRDLKRIEKQHKKDEFKAGKDSAEQAYNQIVHHRNSKVSGGTK